MAETRTRAEIIDEMMDMLCEMQRLEAENDGLLALLAAARQGEEDTEVLAIIPREDVERLADDLECSTAPIKNQAARMLRQLRRERDRFLSLCRVGRQGAEDTARLDWWQAQRTNTLAPVMDAEGWRLHEPDVLRPLAVPFARTLRDAIDAARAASQPEEVSRG